MARRNLLAEAQVTAAAEYAPQVAALGEALRQARRDRNSAIRAAAAASGGIARSLKEARGRVRQAYSGAAGLAAPGQSYSSGAYGGAAANEARMGTTALASSLANALKENSDRRIEAAAGRAYAVSKASAEYAGTAADLRGKRFELAREQGLATGAELSKLTEAQAGRDFTARQNSLDRQSRADLQASSQAFTHHEDALGRRNDRITAGINANADLKKLAAQEKFTAGQNAKDRKNARTIAGMRSAGSGGGPKPTADTTFKGRQAIQAWVDQYAANSDMSTVAGKARKQGIPSPIINAAADLHSKGHIAPQGVAALERMGIAVPQEWKGVQVRPHTRRRATRRK